MDKGAKAVADSANKDKKKPGRIRKFFSMTRLTGLLFLIVMLAIQTQDPYPVEFLRNKTFDTYQRMQPREVKTRPVTIVDLDEESLSEVGQWPWPRSTVGDMVANLFRMGAAVVAFDMAFPEPDRLSPSMIADNVTGLDPALEEELRQLPSNDQYFANIIKQTRVVLGQAGFDREIEDQEYRPPVKKSIAFLGQKPHAFVPVLPSLVRNVPEIEAVAAGHGFFSLFPETDGIVRRVPTLFQFDENIYTGLSIEMLRVVTGRKTILAKSNQGGVESVKITKGLTLPTDQKGRVWPHFSKHDKAKYVSARDVLSGVVDPAMIKGKLIIVGTSAVGLLDIRATPVEGTLPGVEVHANVIESVVDKAFLSRPNNMNGAEFLLTLFAGLIMIILVPMIGAKWTLILFVVIAGGSGATSWYLFTEERLLFDAGFAMVATLGIYVQLTYMGYAAEEAQKKQVRSAFSHYMSPALVERLAEDPSGLKLGGENRPMTLLFCDVRGFTSISELFDAEGLTKLINKFLTPLTNVILNRQGTIDKYMGDCIMAFWNAPLDVENHEREGCISALEMIDSLVEVNDRLEKEAKEEGRKHIPLRIGIGLNTGVCCVGNMGSDQRFDYSVLGDPVNLASRLEGQSKTYGVTIVIGESTYQNVQDLACIELDLIQVKGKTEAVRIFSVLGDDKVAQKPDFIEYAKHHAELLLAYRDQQWAKVREMIKVGNQMIDGLKMEHHGLYDLYEERMQDYEKNPPGPDWDGVFIATTK
ncbi:adenylate/guanylate cyclase domain-containing protein [Terasakiella sp. A23]|uniref:CHASE2 domain-containing protein n=1 Tax=Terasakiella sp. FCG-A23 TaxID=3080561 RepID=UPI002955145A|nr:adenylate/guanylate cyclase domain-containing protein [Terasakiella sp. A23]MDV7338743.1 adenylate/guanylate cyclase domain-containing protein [Terasakiella sp. A23]